MLPEKFSLKINRAKSFNWAGKRELYGPAFKMIYRFIEIDEAPKVGFIVSGKVGGSAVRNKIKRRLSEAVRSRLDKFPNRVEVLIIANKEAAKATYEEICASLDKILPKIHRGQ